jgi:hypothetical protein
MMRAWVLGTKRNGCAVWLRRGHASSGREAPALPAAAHFGICDKPFAAIMMGRAKELRRRPGSDAA